MQYAAQGIPLIDTEIVKLGTHSAGVRRSHPKGAKKKGPFWMETT